MYNSEKAQPIYRAEDNKFIGYILKKDATWLPLNLFGYPLSPAVSTYEEAVKIINAHGLDSLAETWQYYDEQEEDWFNCSIIEVKKDSLTLCITDYGHPEVLQKFTLHNPSMRTIRK